MNEKLTAFYEAVSADDALRAELDEAELATVNGGQDYHYEGFCMCLLVGAAKGCGCFLGGKGKDMNIMKGKCVLGGI